MYLPKIEKEIHSQLVVLLRDIDPRLASGSLAEFKLAELKHFGSLAPASQREGVALHRVSTGSSSQREEARVAFSSLARKIDQRIVEPE